MSKQSIKDFEQEIDALVENSPLWSIPAHALIVSLFYWIDAAANGSRVTVESQAYPEKAKGFPMRLSLLTRLLAKCPSQPTYSTAFDAFLAYRKCDPDLKGFMQVIQYSHFSELMPEVHRGNLVIASTSDKHFTLAHPSLEFGETEAKDIILSELSLPLMVGHHPDVTRYIEEVVAKYDALPEVIALELLHNLCAHHKQHVFEMRLLNDAGFFAATGCTYAAFNRFRAAMHALASLCDGLANAISKLHGIGTGSVTEETLAALLEWTCFAKDEQTFAQLIREIGSLSAAEWDALSGCFTLDLRSKRQIPPYAGDGYFPPLVLLDCGYMVSPTLTRTYLSERNILYVKNKIARKTFDDFVSCELEPNLVAIVRSHIETFDDVKCVANFCWSGGEIDLLVYHARENAALHIQAKAALPPHGARLVKSVESRSLEGLVQLETFRKVGQEEMDKIVSAAVKATVSDVTIIDVLLARACFGTHRIWGAAGGVCLATLATIKLHTSRLQREKRAFSVLAFAAEIELLTRELVEAAKPIWSNGTVDLGSGAVAAPLLGYDVTAIEQARKDMWLKKRSG